MKHLCFFSLMPDTKKSISSFILMLFSDLHCWNLFLDLNFSDHILSLCHVHDYNIKISYAYDFINAWTWFLLA